MSERERYEGDRWWEALCVDLQQAGAESCDSSHDAADAIAKILRGLGESPALDADAAVTLVRAADTLEANMGNASRRPAEEAA